MGIAFFLGRIAIWAEIHLHHMAEGCIAAGGVLEREIGDGEFCLQPFAAFLLEYVNGADIDELKVKSIFVEKGAVLKRFTARAKGRGNRIVKSTCHIFLTVGN